MLRGVNLIDIVGSEIFLYFSHFYIIRAIMDSEDAGAVAKTPTPCFHFILAPG